MPMSVAIRNKCAKGKFLNIVIKCGSEKHQLGPLMAMTAGKPKDLIRLLNGADIRTQN